MTLSNEEIGKFRLQDMITMSPAELADHVAGGVGALIAGNNIGYPSRRALEDFVNMVYATAMFLHRKEFTNEMNTRGLLIDANLVCFVRAEDGVIDKHHILIRHFD